jgi:hypothetical protein
VSPKPPARRPSAALILSVIAIVLALGGTTYAATQLGRNSVGTFQLRDGAVSNAKLRDGSVTLNKLSGQAGCAADTVRLGPGCVELSLRSPQGYREAVATCAALGRRLPFISELVGIASLGNPLGDPELVGDVEQNGGRFDQTTLSADGLVANQETIGTTRSFRCVASPLS